MQGRFCVYLVCSTCKQKNKFCLKRRKTISHLHNVCDRCWLGTDYSNVNFGKKIRVYTLHGEKLYKRKIILPDGQLIGN